jgi:hypothetical protein
MCSKFMQSHKNMVEIHPIWWPPYGICCPACWIWFQIQHFVEILCKLHEKTVEICPIWWPLDVFWPPFVYWIKSRIKIKVRNELKYVFRGPYHIINMPMYTSCKGTMYNTILMNNADNPNEGHNKKQIVLDFAFNDFELL